jgi:hypothetical protein
METSIALIVLGVHIMSTSNVLSAEETLVYITWMTAVLVVWIVNIVVAPNAMHLCPLMKILENMYVMYAANYIPNVQNAVK